MEMQAPPSPSRALPVGAIQDGMFNCPWCARTSTHESGLMAHITLEHEGERLTEEAAHFLEHLGRGICVGCGAFQLCRDSRCPRQACRLTGVPRQPVAGDVVTRLRAHTVRVESDPGPSLDTFAIDTPRVGQAAMAAAVTHGGGDAGGAETQIAGPTQIVQDSAMTETLVVQDSVMMEALAEDVRTPTRSPSQAQQVAPDAETVAREASRSLSRANAASLRGIFNVIGTTGERTQRTRRGVCPVIPANIALRRARLQKGTHVHVPKPLRERLCALFADCLEGVLEADAEWNFFAQHVHGLVLAAVPKGMRPEDEIARRYALIAANNVEGLLIRLEHQAGVRATTRHTATSRASRAERFAREGARSKAVQSLGGGIKQMSPAEQLLWAVQLLPESDITDEIFSTQQEREQAARHGDDSAESVSQGEGAPSNN